MGAILRLVRRTSSAFDPIAPGGYHVGVVLLSGEPMNREKFLNPSAASPRLGDT
jgi:hypothetical protein